MHKDLCCFVMLLIGLTLSCQMRLVALQESSRLLEGARLLSYALISDEDLLLAAPADACTGKSMNVP